MNLKPIFSLFHLIQDVLLNIALICLRLYILVNYIQLEGTLSQIFI